MDQTQDQTHYVRCLKCLKILKCSRYDTTALLEHIKTDHPEIEIVDNKSGAKQNKPSPPSEAMHSVSHDGKKSTMQAPAVSETIAQCEEPNLDTMDPSLPEKDGNIVYTRRYQVNNPAIQTPRRRLLYRTSIEKWRPAKGCIYCPKCGVNKAPLIKTRTERLSTNSCAAACVLGCWPFCFLPYLFLNDNKEYLHCSNCKNFLGLYDRENNCIKPNREFVDMVETVSHEQMPSPAHTSEYNEQRSS